MKKNHYSMISMFLWIWKCKVLLAMRLTLLLCLFCILQSFAVKTYSQNARLSINQKNISIENILQLIENKTDYYFMYSAKSVDVRKTVDIDASNKLVSEILDEIFKDSDISYKIEGRLVALTKNGEASSNYLQQKSMTGKVSDSSGAPLPGVSVVVKGTTNGTITDADGKYTISSVPANATLLFSFVGMKSQEIIVNGKSTIDVTLLEESIGIEEVVAVGYGTQKKVNLTGSVSSVASADMVKRPTHSVGNLLQGKSTGLQIVQSSGEPGNDSPVIRIRGVGTFSSAGNDPLVLVDGVQGDLTKLNPENIESVSVLKDAASASIYGARAANGVILVTTKQGKKGELNIEYSGNYQIQQPTRMPEFVTNSADFMTDWNSANQRANAANYFTQTEIDAFRNATDRVKYPNFNWLDYMIGNGSEQNHFLSLNGGNDKTRFNASLGLTDQTGINDAFTYKKANMMFNINSKLNKVVTFGSNISMNYSQRVEPVMGSSEFMLLVYTAGPNYMPKLSDGSGRWTWRYNNAAWHNRNPAQALAYGNVKHPIYSLAAQTYVDINIAKDLVFEAKGAVNYDAMWDRSHEVPLASYFYSDNTLAATVTGYNVGV
jgi:TonB-linked SusC/RagA family outer membrane protein